MLKNTVSTATVRVFASRRRRGTEPPVATTTTDENGRFRVRDLGSLERFLLYAEADGHRPETEDAITGRDVEVEMAAATRVRGRVLRRGTGAPVEGAEVRAGVERWTAEGWQRFTGAFTDADGHDELGVLEAGDIEEVTVCRAGHAEVEVEFQIDEAREDGYDILVGDEVPLVLELYSHPDGAPLADFAFEFGGHGELTTDADGRTELLYDLERSRRSWYARAEGWCTTWWANDEEEFPRVFRIPLVRGGRITGRVLDPDGRPVAGAQVWLNSNRSRSRRGRGPAVEGLPTGRNLSDGQGDAVTTDAAGRFALEGLAPMRQPRTLGAHHRSLREPAEAKVQLTEIGEELELDLTLRAGTRLSGTVTIDGQPTATSVWWSNDEESGWTQSNDRGQYRFEAVPPGTVKLDARLERTWDRGKEDRAEEVWIEGASMVHDLALTTDRVEITGRVLDAEGNGVEDVRVSATDDEGYWTSADSAEDGSFRVFVPDDAGKLYDLWARHGGSRAQEEDLAPGSTGVELVLPDTGRLRIAVLDALSREPLESFRLRWRAEGEEEWQQLARRNRDLAHGPDGTFVAELQRGRVELLVEAERAGYRSLFVPAVEVRERENERPRTLLLERGTELVVTFETENEEVRGPLYRWLRRRPLLLTDEQLERGAADDPQVTLTQRLRPSRGPARLPGLLPGTYRVQDVPDSLVLEPSRVVVPAVERHAVTVRVRAK